MISRSFWQEMRPSRQYNPKDTLEVGRDDYKQVRDIEENRKDDMRKKIQYEGMHACMHPSIHTYIHSLKNRINHHQVSPVAGEKKSKSENVAN